MHHAAIPARARVWFDVDTATGDVLAVNGTSWDERGKLAHSIHVPVGPFDDLEAATYLVLEELDVLWAQMELPF